MAETFDSSSEHSSNHLEIRAELKQLRTMFQIAAVSLIILTGTVFVLIYRQVSAIRPQNEQLTIELAEFENSGTAAAIEELRVKLYTFSQQNPDFRPIYTRYFGTNQPAPASSTQPAVQPAPAGNAAKSQPAR